MKFGIEKTPGGHPSENMTALQGGDSVAFPWLRLLPPPSTSAKCSRHASPYVGDADLLVASAASAARAKSALG